MSMEMPDIKSERIAVSPEQLNENIAKLEEVRNSIAHDEKLARDLADLDKTIASMKRRYQEMQN